SLPPKLPLDRAEARAILWSNLAVPGIGSWKAGWRVSGALQMCIAVCGLLVSAVWFIWFVVEWKRAGKLPMLVIYDNDGALPPGYLKYLLIGLAGLGLFGLAMAWAFLTSLLICEEAKRHERR
ncbi:MAG: hypothetical protein EB034_23560, partial [Verrucomicrobia bacterium]|nr:hypothetical protein [Verrucomicrobiota bacterium]